VSQSDVSDTTDEAPETMHSVRPEKLRVLFVHSATRPPLGADTWIHALIMRHLDRDQHEVHVACATGPEDAPTPTYAAVKSIPNLFIKPINLGSELFAKSLFGRGEAVLKTAPAVWNLLELARYVRKHRISIVHTSDRPRDAFVSAIVARMTGAKCIVHVHVTYGDWMSRMLRWSMAQADALIGVSDFVADSLVNGGGYARSKTYGVLNAINLEAWDYHTDPGPVRADLGISPDAIVLACVARVFAPKGQARLIRALGMLRAELPDIKLLIIGQDYPPGNHHSEELRALASKLGVADNVIFTGLRSDVPRLMAAADVFAMPSFEEPFGLVYAEAMAMKRPVIAINSGGTPEVVEHGKSGLLSAEGDDETLAANLKRLITDSKLRSEMGEYGRRQVEERFVPARLAENVSKVYRKLLGRA